MQLVRRDLTPSPDRPGFQRISVDVRVEKSKEVHNFWFEVPDSYRNYVSESGNPWVVMMLPLAMAYGEAIEVPFPVDVHLVDNLLGLMQVWHAWYPGLSRVEIRAPRMEGGVRSARKRGLFFSGGIDSFFSLLRHYDGATGDAEGPVDDLINVGGFDVPITSAEELDTAQQVLDGVARQFDKRHVRVFTNLRTLETPYSLNWIGSHGCALAVVGHLLERAYGELIVASTHDYGHLERIGSHPMTDRLLGSRSMRVVHDGASFTRVQKTALVGRSDIALDSVRVCWESQKYSNCSRCRKCLITMVTLDLLGYKERAQTFDWSSYDVQGLRRLPLTSDSQAILFQGIVEEAQLLGRADIVEALNECLGNNRRQGRIEGTYRRRRQRIEAVVRRLPYLWRYEGQILKLLLG